MKLLVGDIFEFSINENSTSYGQIVKIPNSEVLVIVIFKSLYTNRPDLCELVKDDILLFGNTFDAKFYHKHWVVIGNCIENLNNIVFPHYLIGTDPINIENFKAQKIREAKSEEVNKLEYRKFVAPVRFELALKGFYTGDWNEKFDSLLYAKVVENDKLVNKKDM